MLNYYGCELGHTLGVRAQPNPCRDPMADVSAAFSCLYLLYPPWLGKTEMAANWAASETATRRRKTGDVMEAERQAASEPRSPHASNNP